ncbi:MAG: hypothetical protein AAFY99_10115 [Pseudomonadota bacterium]
MKSLVYTLYREGRAGLSNLAMSLELGVVMATLTDRLLVLKGNNSPAANVVDYDGLVSNAYPSRITDLIDPGVPFADAHTVNLNRFAPHEISSVSPLEAVFFFPSHLTTATDDFTAFKAMRDKHFTVEQSCENIPVLSYSGGPKNQTLGFYSSFFYLDAPSQQRAHRAIKNMRPREHLAAFAELVAADLGEFNAVHIRRGDFKKTSGTTTLKRKPQEAIAAMDRHFGRSDRLVVLTDEANDPFFDAIKEAYHDLIFIDQHILGHHLKAFYDLPTHDSVALAYLSQLIAARSQDFIGTMTSTFTSLIQRMRGLNGSNEQFKFLWNEVPLPGAPVQPGNSEPNDSIPLKNGVMVRKFDGPYSWNLFDQRLNPAWMREWPESFLNETEAVEQAAKRSYSFKEHADDPMEDAGPVHIAFRGKTVTAGSSRMDVAEDIRKLFSMMLLPQPVNGLGEVRLDEVGNQTHLLVDGKKISENSDGYRILRQLYREVAKLFIVSNTDLVWLHAGCVAQNESAVLLPGSWGRGKSTLTLELCQRGWSFLSDDIVPLDPQAGQAVPFPGTPQVREPSRRRLNRNEISTLAKKAIQISADRRQIKPVPVSGLIFPYFKPGANTALSPVSPAQSVGQLLESCLSFHCNPDNTIEALCRSVETLQPHQLVFSDPKEAADAIVEFHQKLPDEEQVRSAVIG